MGRPRRRVGRSIVPLLGAIGLALSVLLGSAVLSPTRQVRAEVPVLNTVNVSSFPESVAVDPVTNRVFVVNAGSGVGTGSISVLDGRTNAQLGTIAIPSGNPYGVAVYAAGRTLFVTNTGTDTVAIVNIDQGTFGTLTADTLSAVGVQRGIAVDNAAQRVYFAVPLLSGVVIYNAQNNAFVMTATVEANPEQIAVNETTGKAYVTSTSSNSVSIVGPGPSHSVTTKDVAAPQQGVAVNSATNDVYATLPGFDPAILARWNDNGPDPAVLLQLANAPSGAAYGVAVNAPTRQVYITRSGAGQGSVLVFDTSSSAVSAPIAVGTGPRGVAIHPNSGFVYVANRGSGTVSVLGVPFLAESAIGSPIAVGARPRGVAVNPTTNRVYVANFGVGADSVSVIDGASAANGGAGTVVGTIAVGTQPLGVAVNPTTNRVYVANRGTGANSVSVINAASPTNGGAGTVVGTIPVGIGPFGLAVNSTTNRVYVSNSDSGSVTVINGNPTAVNGGAGNVIGNPIVLSAGLSGVAVNPATSRVYVANFDDTTVSVINIVNGVVPNEGAVLSPPITVGLNGNAAAINLVTNRVYVPSFSGNTVSAIDANNGNAVSTINVGSGPTTTAVNPATNRVYVTIAGTDVVHVIDGASNTVVGSPISVGSTPFGVAVNPNTGRVYVSNGESPTVSVIGAAYTAKVNGTDVTSVQPGTTVQVTWGGLFGANGSDRIGLYAPGSSNASPVTSRFTNNTGSAGGNGVPAGSIDLPTTGVAPGVYELRFVSGHASLPTLASLRFRLQGSPTAANDASYTVPANRTLVALVGGGLLANDTDPDNPETLTAQVVTQPASGTLNLQANGSFTYTAAANVNGPVTFTYRAVDGDGLQSSPATVTITVTGERPVAVNDAYTMVAGSTLAVPAPGVLANDTDADTPAASLIVNGIMTATTNCCATLSFTGAFTYTPPAGFSGTDSLQYQTRDPQGLVSNAATVTITVLAVPVAANDAYTVNNGSTLTVPAGTGVLANDTDADTPAGSLTAQVVAQPTGGTLSLQSTGAFTYTPRADFAGTDTFTYRAVDPQGNQSAPTTVTLTVGAVACGPRPSVTVQTAVSGGALQATVAATTTNTPNNRLVELRFGTLQNAQVTLDGSAVASGQTVQLPAGTTSQAFTVRRATPGQATTVPVTVVDTCGSWPTFVGGGSAAGF